MRSFYDIIADKRDGRVLTKQDIEFFLDSYMNNSLLDYQMSAMLMAIYIRGMNDEELSAWAMKMLHSGVVMDFSAVDGIKIDKHSTGGVGDKISIPLAPVLGALGFKVPMISGRGLGHTGGTLDKLESIDGFNVNIHIDKFKKMISEFGVSMIGQTPEIVPLDKRLYALRDVTATVASIPLIASSIMSKKMAEGIDGLILDVKVGNGAFMKTMEDAQTLGHTMQGIGEQLGKKVAVLFTNMNEPLGYTIGNTLEIKESVDVLKGKEVPQVTELTLTMAAKLLVLFDKAQSLEEGKTMAQATINNGQAFDKFIEMVELQGGDTKMVTDINKLPFAKHTEEVKADKAGVITEITALSMGKALVRLGGGREKKEDGIDHSVGFVLNKKVGDTVDRGELIYTIHYNDPAKLAKSKDYLSSAVVIEKEAGKLEPLILGAL